MRSVMRFADETEADLAANLYHLRHELAPDGIDGEIVNFLSHVQERARAVPAYTLVQAHFADLGKKGDGRGPAGQLRLQDVDARAGFLTGAPFRVALDTYKEQVLTELTAAMLLDTSNIMGAGVQKRVLHEGKWITEVVRGVDAAITHLYTTLAELKQRVRQGAIEGDFRTEGQKVKEQYELWRDNPDTHFGVLSGIDHIDKVHHGAKNGELVLIMGFVSHLKTSFCLNWLYKAAVFEHRNVAIVSLETPVDVLRTILYVMHAGHPKFEHSLGLGKITFDNVTTGTLTKEQHEHWNVVIDDFVQCADYGRISYKEPQESITIDEIGQWVEGLHRETPLGLLLIDYLGLVDPGKGVSGMEQASNLNRVIRQAKLLAMSFGRGRGIPLLSPFQANREGLKDAEKAGGRYKLTALANAHESERSADLVYYVYLDDHLRNNTELAMGNLKSRNSKLIMDQWHVFADPATRIISNPDPMSRRQAVVTFDDE